jgi:hypothetical protein
MQDAVFKMPMKGKAIYHQVSATKRESYTRGIAAADLGCDQALDVRTQSA